MRLGRELVHARGRDLLLQLCLEPEPVEPDEVAHRATLAVDEAVDQLDGWLPGPRDDPERVVERTVLTVGPAVRSRALQHHSERVRLLDDELRVPPLTRLVEALVRSQYEVGALEPRRVQERAGPMDRELGRAGVDPYVVALHGDAECRRRRARRL